MNVPDMGRGKEKFEQRMAEVAPSILAPNEELITSIYAQRWASFLWIGLLFGLFRTDGWYGAILIPIAAVIFALARRPYYLFLTNQRVALARVSFRSSKRARFEHGIPLGSIAEAEVTKAFFESKLSIKSDDGKTHRFAVIRGWEEEARALAERVAPAAPMGEDLPSQAP